MGSFTNDVRGGRIAGPLRQAFTPESWEGAFAGSVAPDSADHGTYAAGLALNQKLGSIRQILKVSDSAEISATTKLRAFVAIANHDFLVTRDRTKVALDEFQASRASASKDVYAIEQMAAVKLKLPGGFEWMPNEVIEGLVDGIELPVRVVLQDSPSLAGNPQMNKVDWDAVTYELNLGILYRFAEDVWDECLWNGYRMVDRGGAKVFIAEDLDAIRGYRAGLARRTSLAASFSALAAQHQRQALSQGARIRVGEVLSVERRGKRQAIRVSRGAVASELMQRISVQRAYAAEPYYESLLQERLVSLGGLNLSMLLDAWTVLSCTANVMVRAMETRHVRNADDEQANVWMPEYAATLQTEALVDALETAAGIRKRDRKSVV